MDKTSNFKKIIKICLLLALITIIISISVNAQNKTIDIKGLRYEPSELVIKQGMTVVWVNKDTSKTHQVYQTYNKFPRSPVLFPYDKYNVTFNELGTYEYRDAAKPSRMIGYILVLAAEDYVEEVVNVTNQTINATNQTVNETTNQTVNISTSNETVNLSGTITLDGPEETAPANESPEEPVVLTSPPKEGASKLWWIIPIIVAILIIGFFVGKQFINIKPIEIKEEVVKSKKHELDLTQQKKEPLAKVLKVEDNIVELKCPHCSNASKTIANKQGQINVTCDNCGANISAKI